MTHQEAQYRAFISYSHADARVVEWLHRALESYRIPAKLVGFETALGPVPALLGSLFRDRNELPAAGDLSTELLGALKRSQFLIVVCSPASAKSTWVNEEVRQFKLLHGPSQGEGTARVLALVVDGDPDDARVSACFPPALKFHVLPDGTISSDPVEPIAADIRPEADGKKLAKLKLVAGLTGLPLDALVQRESARRQQRLLLVAAVSLALTAAMAVLTVLAIRGQREAEQQRAQADGLVEYMLTDLRNKLEPVGRLEVLDSVGQKALAYYEAQELSALDADELGRRARALHLVGEVRDLRGDSIGALKAFREAERATGELLARDPDMPDRMFDHAQSVFFVGQTAWARQDAKTAEQRFRTYAELADAMAQTDPANAKWKAEQGYAANSLGVLYLKRLQADQAIAQFQRYARVTAELAAAAPADSGKQWEAGQAHAWLADAFRLKGDRPRARAARLRELAIYTGILASDAGHADSRISQGRAREALAELDLLDGDTAAAIERSRAAFQDLEASISQDPDNHLWLELAVSAANRRSEALVLAGRWPEAVQTSRWAAAMSRQLMTEDPKNANWRVLGLNSAWTGIAVRLGMGDRAGARAEIQAFRKKNDMAADRQAGRGTQAAWIMVLSLDAADRLAAGDRAGAVETARLASGFVGPAPDQRALAMLAALRRLLPEAGIAEPALTNRYPAAGLLARVAAA